TTVVRGPWTVDCGLFEEPSLPYPGDEDHVTRAAPTLPRADVARLDGESRRVQVPREALVLARRPHSQHAVRAERGAHRSQRCRSGDLPVARRGERVGAVVHVEPDGVAVSAALA